MARAGVSLESVVGRIQFLAAAEPQEAASSRTAVYLFDSEASGLLKGLDDGSTRITSTSINSKSESLHRGRVT